MLCIKQTISKSVKGSTTKKLLVLYGFENWKVEWTSTSTLFSKNVHEYFRATNASGSNKSG